MIYIFLLNTLCSFGLLSYVFKRLYSFIKLHFNKISIRNVLITDVFTDVELNLLYVGQYIANLDG